MIRGHEIGIAPDKAFASIQLLERRSLLSAVAVDSIAWGVGPLSYYDPSIGASIHVADGTNHVATVKSVTASPGSVIIFAEAEDSTLNINLSDGKVSEDGRQYSFSFTYYPPDYPYDYGQGLSTFSITTPNGTFTDTL